MASTVGVDLDNPFLRLLNAWLAGMNLYSVVMKLTPGDAGWVHYYLYNCYRPQHPNFWVEKVLPALRRRFARKPRPVGREVNIFDVVKDAVAIEDLAGRFTALMPSGNRLKGLCPLHEEKTPSFVIFPDQGRWRCFGRCAEGGDVITLAQRLMDKGLL